MGEGEGVGVRADCSRVTSSETGFEKKDDKGRDRSPTPALEAFSHLNRFQTGYKPHWPNAH